MRHAKSDWHADVNSDFERPLNARGRDNSHLVGDYLQKEKLMPDKILYSSAKRTTQTMEIIVQSAKWQELYNHGMIEKSDSLYLCSTYQLIKEVTQTDCHINTLLLINHQPTCAEVIFQLCGQRVEMKTASFAIIECHMEDWALIESCEKVLIKHITPAQLLQYRR